VSDNLEERLKAALDARAQTFEAHPNSWLAVQRRTRSPQPRGRWLVAALPIALLAIFVPILLNGGLGRNSANDPTDLYRSLMRELTPAGEEVVFDDPATGKPLRLWFARTGSGIPELCKIVEPPDGDPYGSCRNVRFEEGGPIRGLYDGSTRTDTPTDYVDYGVATNDVVKATAVLEGGGRMDATLHRSDGAPMAIWTLALSAKERVAKVQVTDAKGRQGADASPYFMQESHRETPIGQPLKLPGGITVRPYDDKVQGRHLYWFRGGGEVGRLNIEGKNDNPHGVSSSQDGVIYTALPRDTAKIDVVIGSDAPITLMGSADPWNLGLNLFTTTRSLPLDWSRGHTTTGYDAAGKQLWLESKPPYTKKPQQVVERLLGETMTVPGTEDFSNGPVRFSFRERPALDGPPKEGKKEVNLCAQGGAQGTGMDDGVASARCSPTRMEMGGFSSGKVESYLPLPGNVVAYGVAQDDWLSVDAVMEDGTRVHGTVTRGKDTPYPLWWVAYPRDRQRAALAFKVRGKQLEQVEITGHWCWDDQKPISTGQIFDGGLTANLHAGSCLKWWRNGKEQGGAFEPTPGGKLSGMIAAGELPLKWGQDRGFFYGFTLPDTAKVDVTLKDGGRATAETVPDPWGQGVRLFAGPVPKKVANQGLWWEGMRFIGYAADGRVLWTYEPTTQ
jgi:hypothetical protein